jgi:hypothetical protein
VDLWQLFREFGLPLGGLIVILIGGYRRWWTWGYQLTDCERERDTMRLECEKRIAEERAASLKRESDLQAAISHWQSMVFEILGPVTGLAEAIRARDRKQQ